MEVWYLYHRKTTTLYAFNIICYYGYDCSRAMMLEINIPDAIYQNVLSAYFEFVFYGKESIILLCYAISCKPAFV